MSHPMHRIVSHRIDIRAGKASLIARDVEDFEPVIATAYLDEEEYAYLDCLAGRVNGMRVGEAQAAWHKTCVNLIRRAV